MTEPKQKKQKQTKNAVSLTKEEWKTTEFYWLCVLDLIGLLIAWQKYLGEPEHAYTLPEVKRDVLNALNDCSSEFGDSLPLEDVYRALAEKLAQMRIAKGEILKVKQSDLNVN